MNKPKRLAVIGAGYLQMPLVQKARELGIETYCFAWEQDSVCRDECTKYFPISITEKDAILDECKTLSPDGVLSIASDTAVTTVNYIAAKLGLTGNSIKSGELCTNKYLMRETLSSAGLPCPKFFVVDSTSQIHSAADNLAFPLIVKPVDRSGSLGVMKVNNRSELLNAVKECLDISFCGQAIVEEFIRGCEVSVETISWNGEHHHLAITDKITSGPPHFVELEHHQPSRLPSEICSESTQITRKSLTKLGITNGASHTELIIDGKDIFITEIGARMGGDFIGSDLVELSTGYDFVKGVIDISLGRFHPPKIGIQACSGVLFKAAGFNGLEKVVGSEAMFPQIIRSVPINNSNGPLKSSSDRTHYVLYQSDERFQPTMFTNTG